MTYEDYEDIIKALSEEALVKCWKCHSKMQDNEEICPNCGAQQEISGKENEEKCPQCGIKIYDPEQMKIHIMQKHKEIKEASIDSSFPEDEDHAEIKQKLKIGSNDVIFGPTSNYSEDKIKNVIPMTVRKTENYSVEFLRKVDPEFKIINKALERGYAQWVNQTDTQSLDSLIRFIDAGEGSGENKNEIMCPTCFGIESVTCDVCKGKRTIDIKSPAHEIIGEFSCPYDGSNYHDFGDLMKHTLFDHANIGSNEVENHEEKKCKYGCGFKTSSQDELDDHERGHRGAISEQVSNEIITCDTCKDLELEPNTFSNMEKYKQHLKGHKEAEKTNEAKINPNEPYSCHNCKFDLMGDKMMAHQKQFPKHKIDMIPYEKEVSSKCPTCLGAGDYDLVSGNRTTVKKCEDCGGTGKRNPKIKYDESFDLDAWLKSEESRDKEMSLEEAIQALEEDSTDGVRSQRNLDDLKKKDEFGKCVKCGIRYNDHDDKKEGHDFIAPIAKESDWKYCDNCDGRGYTTYNNGYVEKEKECPVCKGMKIVDVKESLANEDGLGILDAILDPEDEEQRDIQKGVKNPSSGGGAGSQYGSKLGDMIYNKISPQKDESEAKEGGPGSGRDGHEKWMRGVEEFTDMQYGITGKPNGTTHKYCDNCIGVRNVQEGKCTICGKKNFYSGDEVMYSVEKDYEKDHKCGYCDKTFDFNDELQRHKLDTGHDVLEESSHDDNGEKKHTPYTLKSPPKKMTSSEALIARSDTTGIYNILGFDSADSELYKVEEWYNGQKHEWKEKLMEENVRDLDDSYKAYEVLDSDLKTIIYTKWTERGNEFAGETKGMPFMSLKREKFDTGMIPTLVPPEEFKVIDLDQSEEIYDDAMQRIGSKKAGEVFTNIGEEDG